MKFTFSQSRETYLFLVKENLNLVRKLLSKNKTEPYDPQHPEVLYKGRANHLQVMTLLGTTAEHLIKIIISKRGYVINEIKCVKEEVNKKKVTYHKNLIPFYSAIKIFKDSNSSNYFNKIGSYYVDYGDPKRKYLNKYSQITPQNCLNILRDIRNHYLHKADPQSEQQGIIWYCFNFLVWLANKEFPDFFKSNKFVGSKEIIKLF